MVRFRWDIRRERKQPAEHRPFTNGGRRSWFDADGHANRRRSNSHRDAANNDARRRDDIRSRNNSPRHAKCGDDAYAGENAYTDFDAHRRLNARNRHCIPHAAKR